MGNTIAEYRHKDRNSQIYLSIFATNRAIVGSSEQWKLSIPGTRKIIPPKRIYHDLFIYGYGTPFVIGPPLRRFPFDIPPGSFESHFWEGTIVWKSIIIQIKTIYFTFHTTE